jgi:imidazole glycerol-phosphate synthase subunit HisH
LVGPLKDLVLTHKKPILGVCLGMQLMCRTSEEGTQDGLAFIDAHVRRFEFTGERRLKVPHMGWCHLDVARNAPLLDGLDESARFYFVHSYYVDCVVEGDVLARSFHGHPFVSAFQRNNVQGVQFHPEKSHRFGIRLFRNFVEQTV